jgi:hypothetical protein
MALRQARSEPALVAGTPPAKTPPAAARLERLDVEVVRKDVLKEQNQS